MIMANNNAVTFNFTPAMQTHSTGTDLLKSAKAQDPWPGLQLKARHGDKESITTIVYNDLMTTGLDPGYDIGQFSTGPAVEIYTSMVEKDFGVNLARQALPVTGAGGMTVPVGIDFESGGEVTFKATVTVPIGSYKFWLEDRIKGIYTDLATNSYTVNLPPNTYGTGRFFIIASANTPTGVEKPQYDDTVIRIWTSGDKAIIKGEIGDKAICEVYDINGKMILKRILPDNNLNTVDLPQNLRGVFLIRVIDGAKVTTRKVAIL